MRDTDIKSAVVRNRPDVGVFAIGGPLDAKIAEKIEGRLRSAASRKIRTLVLDLEEVRYINSMGMTYLVRLSDQLESKGGALHLANAQPKVKLILEMMGLTTFLKVYPSVQGALRVAVASRTSVARAAGK